MISIYTTTTCAYCQIVKKYLKSKSIEFKELNIDEDENARLSLIQATGAMTVPVTTNGSRYVIGYNLPDLKQLIQETIA